MSPLGMLVLRVMRGGSIGAAVFVVLVIGIEMWKHWRFGGWASIGRPDWLFLALLVAMLAGFVYLIRAISRELAKSGP